MPLSKYLIRNEYSLADPELYRSADKDDPEALLEAIAMSGLVGLLRQLGDLAEFAAEIFHDLHEEVMATASRGHNLMARVKQLEAEVPSLEKAFFSQTHHSSFFTNGGIDWHPNFRSEQNIITHGNLPRLIMDSYEECHGPPRLFLLDKFDVAGAGACLKRYTDPSFFKMESASSITATLEVHKEKRIRKGKKKGARLRDKEAPNVVPTHSKLHQLLLEERIENGYSNPARLVKLKKRQLNGSAVETKTGKSYMEKFLETPSVDHKIICETSVFPLPVKLTSDDTSEAGIKILEISSISPVKKSIGNEKTSSSPNKQELELKPFSEVVGKTSGDLGKMKEQISVGVTDEMSYNHLKLPDEKELAINEQKKIEGSLDGYHSDDVTSEVDNYMDALMTMESELETDSEYNKPKKSFLNIQKVTDTNNKEEHQLQAQFSDSQSFGDSSTSVDINSFKQDRNEEHIQVKARLSDSHSTETSSTLDNSSFRRGGDEHVELQAHFSDSESFGNSSMTDENSSFKKDRSYFPHSDSLSTVVENIHSEPILFGTTKYYEPKIEDATTNQLPQIGELQYTESGKFVMHDDDAHDHEEEISDSGQASSDLLTAGQVLCSDLEPATPVTLPAGTQSDEILSDAAEHNVRLDDDADRTGLVGSIDSKPHSPSLIKYDACPVDSSDKISLDNLVDDDAHIQSDDSLQVSNDLELAHEDECCDHSEIKMFQAESHKENSSEISVCRDIGSQGEDPVFPSMEELDLNSCINQMLDCRGSKDEDCISARQLSLEDLSPVVKAPPVSCFNGELSSGLIHSNPQDEPGSTEIEIPFSDVPSNYEDIHKLVHGDEINGSTCTVDPVEGGGHFKHPSSPDKHVMANGVVTEIVQSDDQAVYSFPFVDSAKNDKGIVTCPASGLICSPSRSLSNLQEPILAFSDSYQMEMESNGVELTEISMDSNTDQHEKEMEVHEAVARESLTELEGGHPEIASVDVQMNLNKSVPCDLSDSENNIQKSSPTEKFQHSASLYDANKVSEFPWLDIQQSESVFYGHNDLLLNGRDSFSPPPCNQPESETDLEPPLQSQVGEQHAEFLLKDKENFASGKQSQQMQIYQLEQGGTHATSEPVSEIPADEPSFYSSPESSGQGINPTKHVVDELKPLLPNLFPKATESNLDEMPPMPPLPPMQWRMGKVEHASLDSQREELEVSPASVQRMQPLMPDKKSQFDLPASDREALLYQTPFLPVMAVESDKLQHSSGISVGISGHPVAIPFHLPIMANEAKGQYNYLVVDRNQIQNPFLTLPVVSTGMHPPHGYIVASEGEMVQNSNPYAPILSDVHAVSGHDSISQQENPSQPLSQLMRETSSDDKTLEQSISDVVCKDGPPSCHVIASEGEMVQNSNPCPPIPSAECADSGLGSISPLEKPTQSPSQLMREINSDDKTLQQSMSNVVSMDRPPHGLVVASEGELAPNSNPCFSIPSAESAVSGHDSTSSQEKLTQPPSQLMTETSSEVKTLHQSISTVEGEQERPNISLVSPPNMESMEPNQCFLPFDGETTSSVDTSAQTSDFESERPNGRPKNKLPRPRHPLIDAVAAHDKSKLRRVTERVMPQITPKVDERDSLLEQIRTKSFNLKPAMATRPSTQGPKTNLKLAAILEKANAIRQALAGSDDEDDDADSWSES